MRKQNMKIREECWGLEGEKTDKNVLQVPLDDWLNDLLNRSMNGREVLEKMKKQVMKENPSISFIEVLSSVLTIYHLFIHSFIHRARHQIRRKSVGEI